MRLYLHSKKYWDDEKEKNAKDTIRKSILKAFQAAEKIPKPSIEHMFTDVYHEKTPILKRQEAEMHRIVEEYPEHYQNKH